MGTVLIAFVPSYATIGLAAPALVLIGRLLQGFSAGVELGGVSVYLAEMAPPNQKGFYVSWQSGSQQVAIIVAAIIGYVLNTSIAPQTMSDWGWRIPFFIGSLIVPFIFIIRRSLQETEAFLARTRHPTLSEVFRSIISNWWIVLAGMLLVVMTTVSFYLITVYTPTFGKSVLKLSITDSLIVTFCVALSNLFWLPVMGAAVRPHWPASDSHGLYHSHDSDSLSHDLVVGLASVVRTHADCRTVAFVSLRRI